MGERSTYAWTIDYNAAASIPRETINATDLVADASGGGYALADNTGRVVWASPAAMVAAVRCGDAVAEATVSG